MSYCWRTSFHPPEPTVLHEQFHGPVPSKKPETPYPTKPQAALTSVVGPLLAPGSLAWFALPGGGQQPVGPVAGGMPALEVVQGGVQLLRVRGRMRLATVQAA
jgi:hypothetical protein